MKQIRNLVERGAIGLVGHEFVQFPEKREDEHDGVSHASGVREPAGAPDQIVFRADTIQLAVRGLGAFAFERCVGTP
ncbi:hypothetical protein [Mesorhizobium sp.]|uniref:hypothetical protein n=1 Tax=Mesorhizobium sp. TaxID=1871066 RepID=UPI000FE50EBD|nr:hypothetical protein [Mesorhizobium sp.]RWO56866.1 MAG: hypothetical protein EOS14_25465 [Mesorhizobium sp.]